MPDIVTNVLTAMTTETKDFVVAFVSTYWALILGIGAIIAIGSYLFRLGRGGGR